MAEETSVRVGRWRPFDILSPGAWIILVIAVVSTVVVNAWPVPEHDGVELWTFSRNHSDLYQRLAAESRADPGTDPLDVFTIDGVALQRRTLSGFWSGTPLADLIEVERSMMGNFVMGPLEDIGFTDLTDRLQQEGLDEEINPASFSPWMSRGRIFGLPHDVHPVLLCYRSDLVEAAGIDVSRIETWADFEREMRPLLADLDGDGRNDRFLLNLWHTRIDEIEPLLLQAGGGTFNEDDELIVDCDENVRVVAHSVAWMVGPNRIAIDAPNFDPSGNQLRLEGKVICQIMPDWLGGVFRQDLPALSGKLKLMPLPAWEAGGRRTSVWGGTMLGIPKATEDFERAWAKAKDLYLSPELAERLFRNSMLISPVTSFWDSAFYQEPVEYFSGQKAGTLFIEQAPHVPFRSSNPYHTMARGRIGEAVTTLYRDAESGRLGPVADLTAEKLEPRARELLEEAATLVRREMSRNVFLAEEATRE